MSGSGETKPDIILNSPVGSKPAIYKWPLTYVSKGQKIDGAEEIIETIRWVAREYPEFKPAIENLLPDQPDLKSYECIKSLCDKYNKIPDMVMKMNKGTSVALKTSSRASQGLLKHIIQQVYNYAVTDPTELNKYSPFSSETYGETSFEFMAQLIDKNQFKPKETDVFIDLGSGVGHLVLQMAASVECKKCYGIEISDVPAGYAKVMEERFKFWMNWHGKTYTEFELFHGDFFEKKYVEIIKNATFILVNNFAFKPDVDHKLKQRFLDLKDGTQILSSKPFCSPKSRVTERNLTDIGSIMRVVEIQPELKKDTVSWTPKPLPYYLHVLDASPVEKYYERQKRRQGRSTAEKGRPNKRRKTGKVGSESFSDDSDDNIVYGPTTRKAWSEWCNSGNMNASNRTSTDSIKTGSSRNNSTDTENLSESPQDEDSTAPKVKDPEPQRRDKRSDSQNSDKQSTTSQASGGQVKGGQNSGQPAKSCLDKKRDYAIKKTTPPSFIQNAPPSALYSISKPADPSNASSASKIPNIVIKVKPSVEAKVQEYQPTTRSSVPENVKPEPKVNDENGKKLRQRKKPASSQQQAESTPNSPIKGASPSKTDQETASSVPTNSNNTSPYGVRGKKAPSTSRAQSRSTTAKRKAAAADKTISLDLLHAKTVESFSGSIGYYAQPAPGCEDHNLRSITDTPSLPKVVIKDPSMFVTSFLGSKNMDRFMEQTKKEFEEFAKKLQQPHSKDNLLKGIDHERLKNLELHRVEDELTRHIKFLADRIPKAMKSHCDELGIKSSPRSLVTQLGALLRKHQDLTAYYIQLKAALQPSQRTINPPAAHSNSNQSISSPYKVAATPATLDLSLK